MKQIKLNGKDIKIINQIKQCPYCNKGIKPVALNSVQIRQSEYSQETLSIIYQCPNCDGLIYTEHDDIGGNREFLWKEIVSYPYNLEKEDFGEEINNISPSFSVIYNQSKQAESMGLNEICGVGYRRSLEFLIKDYAKKEHPEEQEKIEKRPLKQCIDTYITHPELKACATGAAFLGNDEVHYIRKWIDKDIEDLKRLIRLTIAWIKMEELTRQYKLEMSL